MTPRERIAARIRALLAKTVENGCTEDEAIAAAEKAAELLGRYNMTIDEAEMRASPFSHHQEQHDDPVGERLWKVAAGISHLTGARYWKSQPGVFPFEISFFGFEHEVEVSKYLLEICANAMRAQHDRIDRAVGLLSRRRERRYLYPFLDGMADRLWIRLKEMKPPEPTGTGLIVLRDDLIAVAMKDAGFETQSRRTRPSRDFEDGYRAGQSAGDGVALNRGLRGHAAAGYLA